MISTEMEKRVVLNGLYCSIRFAGVDRHEEPVEVFDGMTVADCLRLYGDTMVEHNTDTMLEHNNANEVILTYNTHYKMVRVQLTLASL